MAKPPSKEFTLVAESGRERERERDAALVSCSEAWHVACGSEELKSEPLKLTIQGVAMVLFRTEKGRVGALLDRCPHRNVPLSMGEVDGEVLRCAHHGWEFSTDGVCRYSPSLPSECVTEGRAATSFPVREREGIVWVFSSAESSLET